MQIRIAMAYSETLKKLRTQFYTLLHLSHDDSLYRNSLYLMFSTGIMATLGFLFWVINTRLYSNLEIGLATTLLSVVNLITSFSFLGLDIALIRYLPKSKQKNDQINTSFLTSVIVALALTLIFFLSLNRYFPRLSFIKEHFYYLLLFIIFVTVSVISSLLESIFIAYRNSRFVLIKSTIFSLLKLLFPFLLFALGVFGIISSWMLALAASAGVGIFILIKKFSYVPKITIKKYVINEVRRFSFGNYIAGFLNGLPSMVLPIIITHNINPEVTAYFYISMMIAGMLFVIPQAATQSLFAEGSLNEEDLSAHTKKAIRIITIILIPSILAIFLFGKYILLIFGKDYSIHATSFLLLLAISSIALAFSSIATTILKIKHEINYLILFGFLGTSLVLGLSYLLAQYQLVGIGIAWVIGQSIVGISSCLLLFKKRFVYF